MKKKCTLHIKNLSISAYYIKSTSIPFRTWAQLGTHTTFLTVDGINMYPNISAANLGFFEITEHRELKNLKKLVLIYCLYVINLFVGLWGPNHVFVCSKLCLFHEPALCHGENVRWIMIYSLSSRNWQLYKQ